MRILIPLFIYFLASNFNDLKEIVLVWNSNFLEAILRKNLYVNNYLFIHFHAPSYNCCFIEIGLLHFLEKCFCSFKVLFIRKQFFVGIFMLIVTYLLIFIFQVLLTSEICDLWLFNKISFHLFKFCSLKKNILSRHLLVNNYLFIQFKNFSPKCFQKKLDA